MTIEILRRHLRSVREVTFSIYDRLETDPNTVRSSLAMTIDNRTVRENPVRLDQWFFFPEVHAWEDEKVVIPGLDKIDFTVPLKGYDAVLPYNRVDIERPNVVARLEQMVGQLPPAFFRMQTRKILEVFRQNSLAYTGQSFFSNAHVHPQDQGNFSNVVALGFADPANPTFDEVKDLLHRVRARFVTNQTIQAELLDEGEVRDSLLVIVHNESHWSLFDQVRTKREFNDNENELRGTFRLLRDAKPTPGQENRIEFVLSTDGGPRPAFLVIDQDARLDAWDGSRNRFSNAYVAVGLEGIFGVKPGYPQTSIQAQ